MTKLKDIIKDIGLLANKKKAQDLQRFFKTGPGEYGEGDVFLGLVAAQSKKITKKYSTLLSITETEQLLHSKIHEHRSIALGILVEKFKKAENNERKKIFGLYLKNTAWINNWNLVDLSAYKIIGAYLLDKPKERQILYSLAKSDNLWEKRISIISTFTFIRENDFSDTLKIAEILLYDQHDLIHKAVGWMLREVGKKNQRKEEVFLKKHYQTIPRTTLRYAIERFSPQKRDFYLGRTKTLPENE